MRIYPGADVVRLSECKAGQFVRSLEYGEVDRFGIVFDACDKEQNLRGVVLLSEEVPTFEVESQPGDMSVLRYAGDVVWDIDNNGPFETNAHDLFNKPGVVTRKEKGWFLNVASLQRLGGPRTAMQLELSSGRLDRYGESLRGVAMFGSWSLFIEEADRPYDARLKMASFTFRKDA